MDRIGWNAPPIHRPLLRREIAGLPELFNEDDTRVSDERDA